jgi:hypothetical protein
MDKNILLLKGALQKDFPAILRKEGLQLKLLVGKPIGFEHQGGIILPDHDVAFVGDFQGPGEIEAEAQGNRGSADGGFFGLPDFILGVAKPGEPIEGDIVQAVKHGELKAPYEGWTPVLPLQG